MGARGPQAAPAQLKVIKGRGNGKDTAGRPINFGPKFGRGAPDAPEWLSDDARSEWDRVVPGLDALDLLKHEDFAALVEHCETWATFIEAIRQVRAEGITIVDPKTGRKHKHPAVAVAEAASQHLRASCRDFGLTPSAEQNLGGSQKSDDSNEDPFSG